MTFNSSGSDVQKWIRRDLSGRPPWAYSGILKLYHRKLWGKFSGQLKQRKVSRVAVAYVSVAWVVMQVGEVTFDALSLPSWSLTFLIVVIALGFPLALVLSWAYEITPQGVLKDTDGEV